MSPPLTIRARSCAPAHHLSLYSFFSLTAFAGGILNTYSRFSVPAFTPVLLNLSFIGFAIWATPYFNPPVLALAWAVFAGGVLQLAFQVPFLVRLRLLPGFKVDWSNEGVWRILRQMARSSAFDRTGESCDQHIFAFLVTGSVSWLNYVTVSRNSDRNAGRGAGHDILPSLSSPTPRVRQRSIAPARLVSRITLFLLFLLPSPSVLLCRLFDPVRRGVLRRRSPLPATR